MKKKRFLIGGFVVLAAVGFVVFQLTSMSTPSLSVSDLVKQDTVYRSSASSQRIISLAGKVIPGTVQQDTKSMVLQFTVNDIQTGQGKIPVF